MSQGIAHFALGAALGALLVAYLLPSVPYPRTVTLLSGGWALVPDAAKLASGSPRLAAFHDSAWADLFWLHRTLDVWDGGDSSEISALLVAALLLASVIAERRAYRLQAVRMRRTLNRPSE